MEADIVCQMAPGQTDARAPCGATQKPFPFLRLPGEIRNLVYRYPRIYRTNSVQLISRGIIFSNMRQPPITRVNRQIRFETLPIFYHTRNFSAHFACFPENHDDAVKNWDRIFNMLFASMHGPGNTLQASNLRFLSYLNFSIQTGSAYFFGLAKVGFTMSSFPFVELDESYEEYGVVDTTDLDWDNTEDVMTAFTEGIDSSMTCQLGIEFFGLDNMRCERADEAADDLAFLMCLISRHCPPLRSHVLANIEASDWIVDVLAEAR
ncbi:hypothetical protein LA080_009289 [Diaporthe eres]|nr:hypothetical protein LA080_009289 [Diaporthe eres]